MLLCLTQLSTILQLYRGGIHIERTDKNGPHKTKDCEARQSECPRKFDNDMQ
jgi:hypothetical protein